MKPIFSAAAVLLASLTAQAQQTATTTNEPAHKIFVLTGCLEGDATAQVFKLTGSTAVGQAPPAAAGTARGSAGSNTNDYLLQPVSSIGEQGVNREQLQSHDRKRVEVTVRPAEMPAPATPPPSTTTTATAKPEQPAPQRYTVVKVVRVAESCK